MRARELDGVLGCLEERDRPSEVVDGGERPGLLERDAAERPVQAHLRVDVAVLDVLGARPELGEQGAGALDVAEVGERVAEVGGVADLGGSIVRLRPRELLEGPLEERDGALGEARAGVGVSEGRVDVGARAGRDELRVDHRGELLDRAELVAAGRGREAEQDARPDERRDVELGLGLVKDRERLGEVGLAVEPQAQLLLGQAQLPCLRGGQLGAGLEVLRADAELAREHAQGLDRRLTRSGLDPGDVGVGDPGCGELPLGDALFEPQTPQASADRLGDDVGHSGHACRRSCLPRLDSVNRAAANS